VATKLEDFPKNQRTKFGRGALIVWGVIPKLGVLGAVKISLASVHLSLCVSIV